MYPSDLLGNTIIPFAYDICQVRIRVCRHLPCSREKTNTQLRTKNNPPAFARGLICSGYYRLEQSTQTQIACSVFGSNSIPDVSTNGFRSLANPFPHISQVKTFSPPQQSHFLIAITLRLLLRLRIRLRTHLRNLRLHR